MKSGISFRSFTIGNLVEYSPIGNSTYQWSRRTEGIIIDIEIMLGGKDAWFTIEQTKPMLNSSCNLTKDYYVIGRRTTIGYGKTFRDIQTIRLLKRREKMNELIIEMFPKTKDAVLIDKHFGSKLNDPLFKMLLKGKEYELLEEAKKMEE